jgi:hypothetical protein
MHSRQFSDAVQSSIPHLTIVNIPIKWWPDLPFKAGVPPFYGTIGIWSLEMNNINLKEWSNI